MKILIWGEIKFGNAYDIFRTIDYSTIFNELKEYCNANYVNVGNKVCIQGIVNSLSSEENEIFFYDPRETWETINSKYDKIVYSAANLFCDGYNELLENISKIFKIQKNKEISNTRSIIL